MNTRNLCVIPLLTGLAVAVPAAAIGRKGSPDIPLAYTPTTAVAEASAAPTADMRAVPVALLISDDRGLDDKAVIGSRTDDDDRRSEVRATNDVAVFVESALTKQARDWTFVLAGPAEAGMLLVGKITQFRVEETNQAVGASYNAEVALDFELRDRSGKKLASGSYLGDASRYGKKVSAGNANEVLSDALAEAFANALSDSTIRSAWAGTSGTSAAGGESASMSPEDALKEIKALMAQGQAEATLQDFLRSRTLTRALGTDDLGSWKAAGVPESVIRVALAMRVK